jgi:hypothetical protein
MFMLLALFASQPDFAGLDDDRLPPVRENLKPRQG